MIFEFSWLVCFYIRIENLQRIFAVLCLVQLYIASIKFVFDLQITNTVHSQVKESG